MKYQKNQIVMHRVNGSCRVKKAYDMSDFLTEQQNSYYVRYVEKRLPDEMVYESDLTEEPLVPCS